MSGKPLKEAIEAFLSDLKKEKRITASGEDTSYSAAWYKKHLKGIKQVVRYLLDHDPALNNGQRYIVEKYLQNLRYLTPKEGIGKEDRIPNEEEVRQLIESADQRLRLMIEFLVQSGCRISEMLGAEVGGSRRNERITYIKILGKKGKEGDIRIKTELFDRIKRGFKGKKYIFEHGVNQYSRIAVTNRIKVLSEKTIQKPVTAHMLRHYRGTVLNEKLGISKASSELGHADIPVTKRFYAHDKVSEDEFLDTLENA